MRKDKVKVIVWGLGAMGSGMAQLIARKQGFEITGICDLNPNYVGKSVKEVLNLENEELADVIIKNDINKLLEGTPCDVVLLATDSFTKKAFPKIKLCLEHKLNVISTAEEMAYPKANEPELTKELDKIAKENGVTVVGTGINPGLMMDLLAVTLTGAMTDVEKIVVKRVNSLSPFGKAVMDEQGVGLSLDEFNKKKNDGKLDGHVGFKESAMMMADALGWKIENFSQDMEAIVTEVDRKSPYGFAKANDVAGVNMTAQCYVDDKLKIDMYHPQQIEPQLEGVSTGDYIIIDGNPKINMAITPEVDGGLGTIAMCVNLIPHVINAKPGLKTMIDLPVPRAIMGDVREMID